MNGSGRSGDLSYQTESLLLFVTAYRRTWISIQTMATTADTLDRSSVEVVKSEICLIACIIEALSSAKLTFSWRE